MFAPRVAPPSKKPVTPPTPARAPKPRIPPSTVVRARAGVARQPQALTVQAGEFAVAGVGAAALEREADLVAARWAQVPLDRPDLAPRSAPNPAAGGGGGAPPDPVSNAIRAGGRALTPRIRNGFEAGFGKTLGAVRIYDHADADDAAASLGALAFTYGNDIGFRAGRFAPDTRAGRTLLAHELAHVLQQSGSPRLQLKEDLAASPPDPVQIRVYVRRVMDGRQLLVELIKQHYGVPEALAEEIRDRNFGRNSGLDRGAADDDVARGYIWVSFPTGQSLLSKQQQERREYFDALEPDEQAAIEATVGGPAKPGSPDEQGAVAAAVRNELVRQHQSGEALKELSDSLFDDLAAPAARPEDAQVVVNIAAKMRGLTKAELAELKQGMLIPLDGWDMVATAVDQFLALLGERIEKEEEKQEDLAAQLHGLEQVYGGYRRFELRARMSPLWALLAVGERRALERELKQAGFAKGIAEFTTVITAYRELFARNSVARARLEMDRYAAQLGAEKRRYSGPKTSGQLAAAVDASAATEQYREADLALVKLFFANTNMMSSIVLSDPLLHEAWEASERADITVAKAAEGHKHVQEPDFPKRALAGTSADRVELLMVDHIDKHLEGIEKTRETLSNHPLLVYDLPDLFAKSLAVQGIPAGSVYERILKDAEGDREAEKLLTQILVAVVGVVAGMLSFGAGTAATAAVFGAVSLAAGGVDLYLTEDKYELEHNAYLANLVADDPSYLWVVLAAAGAFGEAAAFTKALGKALETSDEFRKLVGSFGKSNKGADELAAFTDEFEALTPTLQLDEGLSETILAAARSEAMLQEALVDIAKVPLDLGSLTNLAGDSYAQLVFVVAVARRQKPKSYAKFLEIAEAYNLVPKGLGKADTALLKTGYRKAVKEADEIAAHANKLGFTTDELTLALKQRVDNPLALADFKAQMNAKPVAGQSLASLQAELVRPPWPKPVRDKFPKSSEPPGMEDPHIHHILSLNGRTGYERRLVREGQAILSGEPYNLDPIVGVENLVWAPNKEHILRHTGALVKELKEAAALGATRNEIIDILQRHGELAAAR